MPEAQIFKATYSGIPVYEMMCKGIAVMRRRSDAWLNATQILKVAGFDKPQRTRVLEREIQKGEHEKVQGGYGKYQGTWIPLERGLALAKQYNCESLLKPIIEFQPAAKSPPPAPKHLVSSSASNRPPRRPAAPEAPAAPSTVNTRSSRRQPAEPDQGSENDTLSVAGSEDGTMTPSPSEASSSSRTPSPIRSPSPGGYDMTPANRSRNNRHTIEDRRDSEDEARRHNGTADARAYGDQILEYFISDTNQVPQILISPPIDFDPNMGIDDDGHTALHWACAMGRIRIVKLLLTAGADIFKVNKSGQTPLMRSVMFANNYDVRKFPELYELLHRSTLNIDNYNRTVFHHVVDVAMSKGKTHAARYYMETVLTRLADYPKELADVINFQDEDGETALTMAARCRSKRLVKILIDHGADPKIINGDGKSTEDYILEDERFRSSPVPPSRAASMSFRNAHAAFPALNSSGNYSFGLSSGDRPPLHYSVAGQRASTRCVNDMTSMLDSLAASFDQELREKERDTTQAHALLTNIQAEILESQRAVGQLRTQSETLPITKQNLHNIETELHSRMGRRYRLGWEKWSKDEETREKNIREAAGGALELTPATATFRIDEEPKLEPQYQAPAGTEALGEAESSKGKRKAPSTQTEDISDLTALYSNIPTDPEELARACDALRGEITHHRKRRKQLFDDLVSFQAEAGTSGRMAEYRRLIGAGCGGIPPSEVDQVLGMLLETLESEEPSASTTAWGVSKTPSS
ncbi:transcription factor [Dendrothele bispora CBS 962.96]|uniref:Transcription factor n=1 Tax=Dendrothele bispora (strain CBS 962.96) TaxID=1314807 RepID=A0A4S8MQQ4_DENBC|nr:transcription factor [Dendrothele bispora CBS 962.96]